MYLPLFVSSCSKSSAPCDRVIGACVSMIAHPDQHKRRAMPGGCKEVVVGGARKGNVEQRRRRRSKERKEAQQGAGARKTKEEQKAQSERTAKLHFDKQKQFLRKKGGGNNINKKMDSKHNYRYNRKATYCIKDFKYNRVWGQYNMYIHISIFPRSAFGLVNA